MKTDVRDRELVISGSLIAEVEGRIDAHNGGCLAVSGDTEAFAE